MFKSARLTDRFQRACFQFRTTSQRHSILAMGGLIAAPLLAALTMFDAERGFWKEDTQQKGPSSAFNLPISAFHYYKQLVGFFQLKEKQKKKKITQRWRQRVRYLRNRASPSVWPSLRPSFPPRGATWNIQERIQKKKERETERAR